MADPSIDDVIETVAGETQDENLENQNEQVEDQNSSGQQEDTTVDDNNSTDKQNSAFAAMRVKLSATEAKLVSKDQEIMKLQKQLEAAEKKEQTGEDTESQTNKKLAELESKFNEATERIENERRRSIALAQIRTLRDRYNLSPDDLKNFADKATDNNINLFEHPEQIIANYQVLYSNEIIANEVGKRLQEEVAKIQGGTPPKTGPRGTVVPKSNTSIDSILDEIDKKTKKE